MMLMSSSLGFLLYSFPSVFHGKKQEPILGKFRDIKLTLDIMQTYTNPL